MTFFRIAAGLAAGLLSCAALAASLPSVATGSSFHSQRFGSSGAPDIVVDSATGLDAAAPVPLDIFISRGFSAGFTERRAWVGFQIPQRLEGASSVGLSMTTFVFPGFAPVPVSLSVNQVSSTLPAAGQTVTGSAAGAIFADLGDGPLGSASVPPDGESTIWLSGPIFAELASHAGGILYLGLATHSEFLPLRLSGFALQIAPVSNVPLPPAGWLLGLSLAGMLTAARLRRRGAC